MQKKIITPKIHTTLTVVDDFIRWKATLDEEPLISGITVLEEELEEQDLYKLDVMGSKFERSRFLNCNFENSSFVDTIFENCDFSNSRFSKAYFQRCEFHNCKWLGTDLHEATLKHVRIIKSTLKYANLNGVYLECVKMEQCDLTESFMSEIKYKSWSASECQFMRTNFFHTKLRDFDFTTSFLEDIMISDTLEEIKGAKITAVQALEAARLLELQVE